MRVGEMVVCVWSDDWNDVDEDRNDKLMIPTLGEVYQVLGIRIFEDDTDTLYISIDIGDDDQMYEAFAFRPVAYGPLPARKSKQPV